jgi:zinc transporter, ZIP family
VLEQQERYTRRLMSIPLWLQAALWGLVSGGALLLGALVGVYAQVPRRLVAAIMAFGSGVLISALSFELMEDAFERGGYGSAAIGFVLGASIFTAANLTLNRYGSKHRKRSGDHQLKDVERKGSGAALALGALIDGIPESMVVGISLTEGQGVGLVTVVAVFLSNFPEGLSSATGMKGAGRSKGYIFGVWGSIAMASGLASLLGFHVFDGAPDYIIAATMTVAAGAILAMLVDTMIPEAFEEAHDYAGLICVLGFVLAFALSKLSF